MAFKQLKLWFDKDLAVLLSKKIIAVYPDFPKKTFVKAIDEGIGDLELKDRVALIAEQLNVSVPLPFAEQAKIWIEILGPENEEETGMFKEYYWVMPIAKHVEVYGLNDFVVAMKTIEEITKRNTGEYTIRPYIGKYPTKTIKQMNKWSKSKNKHVRRLASEGGRPRLPWAPKIQQFIDDPSLLLPILETLKDDSSKYVQKSVANCINDIIKDNEAIAKKLLRSWTKDSTKERKWIIKHALRNLIKQEVKWALDCLE